MVCARVVLTQKNPNPDRGCGASADVGTMAGSHAICSRSNACKSPKYLVSKPES